MSLDKHLSLTYLA